MADVFDRAKRSEVMGSIRSKDTRPEMAVRRALHRAGFRFRLHDTKLPGKPDIVLPKRKAVVLVQGCFWHAHFCRLCKMPSSNTEYWTQKLARNRARDEENVAGLQDLGWRVFLIWECRLKSDLAETIKKLRA